MGTFTIKLIYVSLIHYEDKELSKNGQKFNYPKIFGHF